MIKNGLDFSGLSHLVEKLKTYINNLLSYKVDKEDGRSLSANDLTDELKANYDAAYTYSQEEHSPADAEKNIIVAVKKNGTTLSVDDNRAVNVIVPTKTSDLTNDAGFINTLPTYDDATQNASGWMSAADKTKLDGIAANATKTIIDTELLSDSVNPVQNKVVTSKFSEKANISDLAAVATSGDYSDLLNAPTIGNGTVTIIQNGKDKASFTLNQSGDTTVVLTDSDTTYSNATTSIAGLMSAQDKTKLDGIEAGATSGTVVVDDELSDTSVNPLQNKVVTNALSEKVSSSEKGVANGVAELDENGKVPSSQLPSYVDDVIEGYLADSTHFYLDIDKTQLVTGETGKIYVDSLSTDKTYRWSGTAYVVISDTIALGETSSTAYRGDRGKVAYEHASAKGTAFSSGLYKITTNSEGHVTSATSVAKSDITALGVPAQDTTYSAATTSANGLMSASDKSKLDGITASADSVSFAQSLTSGTKVGTITINGTGTDLYAPTNTDTHYTTHVKVGASATATDNAAASNGSVYINALDNTTVRDSHLIKGTGATTVTSDTNGAITINSTNTTYSAATTSANGLMSSADKTKLGYTNIAYATCSTAAATAAKVATVSGNSNWQLQVGSIVVIKFTNTSTASSCTLNVNSTGAKSIYYRGSAITAGIIAAGDTATFIYNGSQYVLISSDSASSSTGDTNVDDVCDGVASITQKKVTTFNTDGSVTETLADGRTKITTITSTGVTEVLKSASGTVLWTNKTTFNSDGSITEERS